MQRLHPVDLILDSLEGGNKDRPEFILKHPIEDVVGISLFYANLPFSYHVFDDTNNRVDLQIIGGATIEDIRIPPGTYTTTGIALVLNDILTDPSGFKFRTFVDFTTSRLVILNECEGFELKFYSETLEHPLGFVPGTTYSVNLKADIKDNNEVIWPSYFIVSPRVVNLTGPNQMFLHANLNTDLYGAVNNGQGVNDIIGFWPVNCNYQGLIRYFNHSPVFFPVTKTIIHSISYYLTIGSRNQYVETSGGTTQTHLPLQGETFQIGLRFYREDNLLQENQNYDHGIRTRHNETIIQPNINIRRHRLPSAILGKKPRR